MSAICPLCGTRHAVTPAYGDPVCPNDSDEHKRAAGPETSIEAAGGQRWWLQKRWPEHGIHTIEDFGLHAFFSKTPPSGDYENHTGRYAHLGEKVVSQHITEEDEGYIQALTDN